MTFEAYDIDPETLNITYSLVENPLDAKMTAMMVSYLYYYRRAVLTNLSATFDENLPGRSQFNSDHHVNFSTPTSCQSATFVRPPFAFVLCFLRHKIIKNPQMR